MRQSICKNSSLIAVVFVLACMACAKPTIHPGAADAFDSQAYDSLLVAQAALDASKAEFAAGHLPPEAKQIINAAGTAYNTARASWVVYHDRKSNKDKLAADLVALTGEIAKVIKLAGRKP